MTSCTVRWALLVTLLTVPLAARADDTPLQSAYAAILRGDYDSGRHAVAEALDGDQHQAAARRAQDWLEDYHQVISSREQLKAKTFAWNVAEAKKALDENRAFLALNFATQAAPYADDPEAYAREPWVRDLTALAVVDAKAYEDAEKWGKALNYYMLLERLDEGNKQYEELRERAARHARIEFSYEDEESLERRIRDVNEDLLSSAVRMINRMYYSEPDFKDTARGALDNLETVARTPKLYRYLDGLGNPALRGHFLRKLEELKRELQSEPQYSYQDLIRLFNRVKQLNRESVEMPDGLLIIEFVEGAIAELDEFTGMIWPADAREFDKMMMGGFEGVGIQLGLDERTNRLKVITPLENSPALEAGIEPDDLIIRVNGEDTKGWTTEDAVQNIMGPAGSEVILTIRRPSSGLEIPFKLHRQRIELYTVRGLSRKANSTDEWDYMLDPEAGVAYIRLTNFLPKSEIDLKHALQEARAQGMKGLVLDLRHNPGGLLDVAIDIVSDFLGSGEVVSTRGRAEPENPLYVRGRAPYNDVPLVVLVNEGSASASEIVAGALQDHSRAIVLGDRTFGKGSVQHVRGLGGGDARLKLTTALYYLPSGRTPHKGPDADHWGVDPDWKLKLTPKEFRKVLERERDRYIIRKDAPSKSNQPLTEEEKEKLLDSLTAEDEEDEEDPPLLSAEDIKRLESDPYEAPNTDPQLETALLLIRVKLAAQIPWPRDLAAACETHPPQ